MGSEQVGGSTPSRCAVLASEEPRGLNRERLMAARSELQGVKDLNRSQRCAVEEALGRRCTIIQGPPGTGKTHVSVKILQNWVEKLGMSPVLATSESNVAVDNIALGLSRLGIKVVRVGRPDKVREQMEALMLDTLVSRQNVAENLQLQEDLPATACGDADRLDFSSKKRQLREDFERRSKILREMQVICATTSAAGGAVLSSFNFQGILVDEVAQATEISTVVPIQ
ncbi:unnamed protein product [Polarella glacialis]|nr:unnamed protein product [Polarella glacialis]